MENYDSRIDAFIAKSADFARPILIHLRKLVHQAAPEIQETMKWSMPFFDCNGPVCQMAAFKQHCAFGFWKATALSDPHKLINQGEASAGSFGRLTSLTDLPADDILMAYIQEAVKLNKDGVKAPMKAKPAAEKKEITIPADFLAQLEEHAEAKAHFGKFSPSKQREYAEWFIEAKTEATRQKRIDQALEWISEGKSRNWKYQS